MLDPKILRAQFLLGNDDDDITSPPPNNHTASEFYYCNIGLPNGAPCNLGKPYDSKKQYLAHLQKQHKICEKEHQNTYVLTNMCPLCEKVFKTRTTAVNHFQRSIQQGRCKGEAREKHPLIPPTSFQCKTCLHKADSFSTLNQHFRAAHFDFVEDGHLNQFNSSNNP